MRNQRWARLMTASLIAVAGLTAINGCGGTTNGGSPESTAAAASPAGTTSTPENALAILCANPNGYKVIEPGEVPVSVFAPVEANEAWRRCLAGGGGGGGGNLSYRGGTSDGAATVGVETAPQVYVVLWGSQWNSSDPSGEASILQSFFASVGGSNWANDDTQYCQGVSTGTYFCNGSGTAAGNQTGMLVSIWRDNATAAPSKPRQSQIANEAIHAAAHFGNTSAAANASVQYVIATAHNNNATGFGTSYCAWHSSTSSSYGDIAYTNLPYITDAGASCGANFNGLGQNAGITIVAGHEFAETVTDQFPSSGWLDSAGSETGDKCAWISSGQGAAASVSLNGNSFPVQSLWSNAFNSNAGGCVLCYGTCP